MYMGGGDERINQMDICYCNYDYNYVVVEREREKAYGRGRSNHDVRLRKNLIAKAP